MVSLEVGDLVREEWNQARPQVVNTTPEDPLAQRVFESEKTTPGRLVRVAFAPVAQFRGDEPMPSATCTMVLVDPWSGLFAGDPEVYSPDEI